MNLTKLLTLLLLLLPGIACAQIPSVEHEYLQGTQMAKVIVCTDDLTVFALSATGKVYYKKVNDADFQLYLPAAALTVTDLAGYSFNELYLLVAPDVIHSFSQGIPKQIKVLNSGVTKINNIAILNAKRAETLRSYYGAKDWLAVATNNGMYPIFRGDDFASARYNRNPTNPGVDGNCRITNASFERVDFQYEETTPSICYPTAVHAYQDPALTTIILPEEIPYSSIVNCTFFETKPYDVNSLDRLKYWGTDQGVFLKISNSCTGMITRFLQGVVVNDLEEFEPFKDMSSNRYVFAATNQGLYFTRETVSTSAESRNFIAVNGISEKVKSIALQVYKPGDVITDESIAICQQTIWVASENGIKQLKITIVDANFNVGISLTFDPLPHGGDQSAPAWSFCGDQKVNIKVGLNSIDPRRYLIRWSDRDIFVDSLQGKFSVDVPAGEWRCHVTLLCEGGELKSPYAFIRKTPAPTIQIAVDGSPYACLGKTVKLVTGTEYVVQWQKNGVDIPDANYANYIATEPGKYRVVANVCPGRFEPSSELEVFIENIPKIALTRSNSRSLCFGESVKLTAPIVSGATYKWSSGETTREIEVIKSGSYFVTVSRSGCSEISNAEAVTVAPQIFKESTQNVKVCTDRNELLTLTAPTGYPVYIWNGVRGISNTLTVKEPGQYVLRIEDAGGCSASMTYVVTPGCAGLDLTKAKVPNAFSPNGDGVNDTWVVQGLDGNQDAHITIYNRYSLVVFEGKGDDPVWDGKFNNQVLQSGTYYYVISDVNGTKPIKGSITLIR